jgi:hypothetical protein
MGGRTPGLYIKPGKDGAGVMARRKKPVKRRPIGRNRKIPFAELVPPTIEPPPADPMLVAYIDTIHKAASVRDRSIYNAQQKFAWDLADAWKKWKVE